MKNPETVTTDSFDQYTAVVDVRSPAEFEEDHIPGAINCPVLSNEERIEVGTLYKQISPFAAKKVGAALVSRNIANHLEQTFAQHPKEWRPLIYCWRGGSRSGAMTHILRQVGWGAAQLEGGYKAYRGYVLDALQTKPAQFRWVVIAGETGSAKSRVLESLAAQGAQVLDLERLACHKGSVLGVLPDRQQPSQKMFESLALHALNQFDPSRPVFVEAESKKIGRVRVPETLLDVMRAKGQVIKLSVPVQARVDFLIRDYDYFLKNTELLLEQLGYLKSLHSEATLADWRAMTLAGDWAGLVTELLTRHYDPAYRKSTIKNYVGYSEAKELLVETLSADTIHQTARSLLDSCDG